MGCGRSKPAFSSPRMVRSCNENDFSGVIRGSSEPSEDHFSSFVGTCCRKRSNIQKNTKVDLDSSIANDFRNGLQVENSLDIHRFQPDIELSTFNRSSEISKVEKFDEQKHDLTSSVQNRVSKNIEVVEESSITDESDERESKILPVQSSLKVPSKSPFKLPYRDEDYKDVITEYSSTDQIETVQNQFEYPKFANMIAITGIGYQHAQELHRKYPLQHIHPDSQEKLSLQTQSSSSFSGSHYGSHTGVQIFPKSSARFVEDSGSSGYQSCSSSI